MIPFNIDTTEDHAAITIEEMETALKKAGTYTGTVK